MANNTTTTNHLPSPAPNGGGTTSSTAVNIILSFLALICIPILIYAFFFLLKCPPYPVEWRRRRNLGEISGGEGDAKAGHVDVVYKSGGDSKKKEETSDEIDYDGECPVCLSMYVDGDEVRVLNVCKHRFHVSCINKWLVSHSNCPVCRASVRLKRVTQPSMAASDDLRQGLPDASSMV
ncbi:hypothetical protein DCAR_0310447 [Daucus carota subsp. sativus]|uniref:Uncharacterized protein n=1 Tax=Daucus carota subsp. sativus TaxID=79200 RepID=A0A165ZVJ7_DAUCS|nr:PREDICTED: RING-H2 finger protein ATL33 [Daucus carota subsp. sativus]WOG91199.1 hypothetical protein DCAR_0310447 [Daucus carota subsp. sativus]